MNLPNALTLGRIAVTPLLIWLPFTASPSARFAAFVLFLVAAWTDYYDGRLARVRGLVTDFGKIVDPLADKLLLVGTFVPMFYHQAPASDPLLRLVGGGDAAHAPVMQAPFVITIGDTRLHMWFYWWIVALVLGRELLMTIIRHVAARRGTIISAIGSAKLKTTLQLIWIGAAYFWFYVVAIAGADGGTATSSRTMALVCGVVGSIAMVASVVLTLYSLALYIVRFGPALVRGTQGPLP